MSRTAASDAVTGRGNAANRRDRPFGLWRGSISEVRIVAALDFRSSDFGGVVFPKFGFRRDVISEVLILATQAFRSAYFVDVKF